MFSRFNIALAATVLFLSGCASTPQIQPDKFTGPKAELADFWTLHSDSKADFFFAEEVNGEKVNNSLAETFRSNQGRGMVVTPRFVSRPLVAGKPVRVTVRAKTHYGAPILALAGTVYLVKGQIEFTPEEGKTYVVNGVLGETYSALWIEEMLSKQVVGQKIEVKGSAKASLFEK